MTKRRTDRLAAGILLPLFGMTAGLIIGLANALLWHALDFSFPVLSPLAMALIGFFAVGVVIEKLAWPYPRIALVSGLLFAIVSYVAYRYTSFELVRGALPNPCFDGTAVVGCPWAVGGWPGFLGYLSAVAEQGIELLPGHLYVAAEMGAPVQGALIRGAALWALWLIELAFVAGLASWGLASVARQPFCHDCGRWFSPPVSVGRVPRPSVNEFLRKIREGDLPGAGRLVLKTGQAAAGELTILKALCPGCRGEHVHLSATRITNRPRGMFPSMAFARVVDAQQYADFVASMG